MIISYKKVTSSGPNGKVITPTATVPDEGMSSGGIRDLGTFGGREYAKVFPGATLTAPDECEVVFEVDLDQVLATYPDLAEFVDDTDREEAIAKFKEQLLEIVAAKAAAFEDNLNKDMYFISSINGYKINGDRRTKSNIQDLITFFDASAVDGTVGYRDYDNQYRALTKEQLQILYAEHIANGNHLYQQKWAMEQAIAEATTITQLQSIDIQFVMTDFTAS